MITMEEEEEKKNLVGVKFKNEKLIQYIVFFLYNLLFVNVCVCLD